MKGVAMKSIKNEKSKVAWRSYFVFLVLLCSLVHGAKPVFRNSTIGVVGCILEGSLAQAEKKSVELFVTQKLVGQLSQLKVPVTVLDRTKLSEIIEEHTLYLSGLVDSYKNVKELDVGSADFLILARITGFTSSIEKLTDSDEMSGSFEVIRNTVNYTLSFEMLNSSTSEVVWNYSQNCVNAKQTDIQEEVNTEKLLFQSLNMSLSDAFKKMVKEIR